MAVSNSLVNTSSQTSKAAQQEAGRMSDFVMLPKVQQQLVNTLGKAEVQRFIASVMSTVSANPKLADCPNSSVVSACLFGESMKLSPSPQLGQFYVVPYWDSKAKQFVAHFQMGYKGYIQLAIRSGYYRKIVVCALKAGEITSWDPLTEEIQAEIGDLDAREEMPTVGYYAMLQLSNGYTKSMYWTRQKMLQHADKYSPAFSLRETKVKTRNGFRTKVSYDDYLAGKFPADDDWMYSSFWYKDPEAMAYKTILRQLLGKWGPLSTDMASALERDYAADIVAEAEPVEQPEANSQREPLSPPEDSRAFLAGENTAGKITAGSVAATAATANPAPDDYAEDPVESFFQAAGC